jgi:hypothetical protein
MGNIIVIVIIIIMNVSLMHVLHRCTLVRSSEHNMPYRTQIHFLRGGQFHLEHSMFCACAVCACVCVCVCVRARMDGMSTTTILSTSCFLQKQNGTVAYSLIAGGAEKVPRLRIKR